MGGWIFDSKASLISKGVFISVLVALHQRGRLFTIWVQHLYFGALDAGDAINTR
jgi:hypothetical protein